MLHGVGLPQSAMKGGLDRLYAENLSLQIRDSDLDAAVVLAQDLPYDADGNPLPDHAQFYVPNSYVAELAGEHPEFIPACSIHPGRPDAMDELERCIEARMPVLKLLPNCLNIDYEEKRYLPFWRRMAEAGMVLLSHTGGEMTVKVFDPDFGDPKKLEPILDCGVTVVAAHAAGRSGLFDLDWTADLLAMFERHSRLFADNSALCTPNRSRTLRHVLPKHVQHRIVHGSDYPVPVSGWGPWFFSRLSWKDHWRIRRETNILQRDLLLKNALGFHADTFTRMDRIIPRPSPSAG